MAKAELEAQVRYQRTTGHHHRRRNHAGRGKKLEGGLLPSNSTTAI
jgi:hypothetical protein